MVSNYSTHPKTFKHPETFKWLWTRQHVFNICQLLWSSDHHSDTKISIPKQKLWVKNFTRSSVIYFLSAVFHLIQLHWKTANILLRQDCQTHGPRAESGLQRHSFQAAGLGEDQRFWRHDHEEPCCVDLIGGRWVWHPWTKRTSRTCACMEYWNDQYCCLKWPA